MSDGRDKVIMFAEIQKLLQSKMPSTLGSKLSTLQRISLLLNPKTVITRNALSNMLINPVYAVRDFAASGMDKALSKKTGVRTLAAPNYKDQAKGWKKACLRAMTIFGAQSTRVTYRQTDTKSATNSAAARRLRGKIRCQRRLRF